VRTVTIRDVEENLVALLDVVKGGEALLILDGGRPVARLAPAAKELADEERLDRLERQGLIRRGNGGIRRLLESSPPVRTEGGASVVDALLEERRRGR